jgi:glycerol-3-phosphate dehydrogenase
MISVAGGKLTTWHAIGRRVAALALGGLGRREPPSAAGPLPGAAPPRVIDERLAARWPDLPADVRSHLGRHYGLVAADVLARADDRPALLERMHPDGPDIWAQVVHARDHEWAATVGDVTRGRTTVALRGLDDDRVRHQVDRLLAGGDGP